MLSKEQIDRLRAAPTSAQLLPIVEGVRPVDLLAHIDAQSHHLSALRAECRAWRAHSQEIAHLQHSKECNEGPDPQCEICQSAIGHGIMPARTHTDSIKALGGE